MKKFVITALVLAPAFVGAQLGPIGNLIGEFDMVLRRLVPITVAVALLVFFWGLIKFITAQGNEQSKVEAKKVMTWSIIALFIMVSVWGIIEFIQMAFLGGADFGAPSLNLL